MHLRGLNVRQLYMLIEEGVNYRNAYVFFFCISGILLPF